MYIGTKTRKDNLPPRARGTQRKIRILTTNEHEGILEMGQLIIHHLNAYNFYTTIADGAVFEDALTLEQVKDYIEEQYGQQGLRNLPDRLQRAKEKGTSSLIDESISDTLRCNRAGENEEHLTDDEFIKQFLTIL